MSNNNQHKAGYKHTPLGWIPEEWEIKDLINVASVKRGRFSPRPRNDPKFYGGNIPFVQTSDITNSNGKVNSFTQTLNAEGLKVSVLFPAGTILMTIASNVGHTAILELDMACPDSLVGIICKDNIDNNYLNYFFSYNQKRIEYIAPGAQKNINIEFLEPLPIVYPEVKEQLKIATILSTWDEAITKTQQLIAQLQQRNKGLMQQLLSGKKRLKGFANSEWKMIPLSSLFERVKRTSPENINNVEVLTISGRFGFLSQKEKFNRVIAGESLKNYTLLRRGEFSYNKGNSLAYQYGCVFKLDEYPEALVPNVYISFKPIAEIDTDYYAYYFKHDLLKPSLAKIISSGARMDGLLNVNAEDFFKIKVPVPSYKEQCLIGGILNNSHKELTLYKQKLLVLQQQKKGLMQKLLTGEVRVKFDNNQN